MAQNLPELLAELDRKVAAVVSDAKQARPEGLEESAAVAAISGFLIAIGIRTAKEHNCPRPVTEAIIKETLDKTYADSSEVSGPSDENGPPTPRDPSAEQSRPNE